MTVLLALAVTLSQALAPSPGPPEPCAALDVPGHGAAAVCPPGAPGMRPVIVVLHGNADRPEWICPVWQQIAAGQAWVLCPRGVRRTEHPAADRWTYGKPAEVRREVTAAVDVLRLREPTRVAPGPIVLAGFSLGAYLAARLAVEEPARFPLVMAHEGGLGVWTRAAGQRFQQRGGRAVLLTCGERSCADKAAGRCTALERRGVRCEAVLVEGLGHEYTGKFAAAVAAAFGRLRGGWRL